MFVKSAIHVIVIHLRRGGTFSVMVIIIGNGHRDLGLNPGLRSLHFLGY